ncbi:MAG: tripartite tricarboxylate transporter permease, partial [Bacteroidetes bacterium]|nr:tripartite tricarboxylate transporter permease [Bacteroidota bacterium]
APESSTALVVLPGHKMLAEGEGYEALKLTVVGGIVAFMLTIILLPLLKVIIKIVEPHIAFLTAPVLLVMSIYFIIQEVENKKVVWAIIIYILSGVLGVIVLNGLYVKQSLFPMLSGLFGVSMLITSLGMCLFNSAESSVYLSDNGSFKILSNFS